MNIRFLKAALVLSAVMLAGCATQRESMIAVTDNLDHGKMGAVDKHATDHMVNVYWVNPPRKTQERNTQDKGDGGL